MKVISFSQGYSLKQLRPFIASAVQYGVDFTILSPDVTGPNIQACEPVSTTGEDVLYRNRWGRYLEALKATSEENIVICDSRDVIFNNTLDHLIFKRFNASEESQPVGACYINCVWLAKAFGDVITDAVKPFNILCAGVVWGKREWLIKWCEWIIQAGKTYPTMDQGLLNYAARHEAFPVLTHPNGRYVLTGCRVPDERVKIVDGVAFMHDVCRPVIVHQWDRVPKLKKFVEEVYQ